MPRRARVGAAVTVGGEVLGVLVQLALVYLGIQLFLLDDDDVDALLILLWCVVATFYLLVTVIGLNVMVRLDRPEPSVTRALIGHPLTRLLSTFLSFAASLLGLREAIVVIVNIGQDAVDPFIEFSAIWTMLLSWALFNWGFARIYYSRYHRAAEPPLLFPGTNEPRLTDFVYFSFTNATTFGTSDIQVVTSRMRWTVIWHTTFAFFFNALIIVLSMNVIAKGDLFSDLLV